MAAAVAIVKVTSTEAMKEPFVRAVARSSAPSVIMRTMGYRKKKMIRAPQNISTALNDAFDSISSLWGTSLRTWR